MRSSSGWKTDFPPSVIAITTYDVVLTCGNILSKGKS